ncbi:MAG: autotransporter domain-containing protein [Planctomycetes bacterium]|nr:autotransporter domain-containing protein [Planctomycetota bacterium]
MQPGPDSSSIASAQALRAEAPAMGMVTSATVSGSGTAFGSQLTLFDSFLVDSFGNSPYANMYLESSYFSVAGSFTLIPEGYGFFQGSNVLSVLNGAILDTGNSIHGLPVSGDGLLGGTVFIELKNGLLSNSTYCNYGVFTEAELAMFKDLGYDIDLKSQYGYSVYGNGQVEDNTTGFYARNAAGDGWLEGEYNRNVGAIGLHIYGAGNTITQSADILSAGAGSAGIRIDGHDPTLSTYGNNSVTVAPDVRVHAHGADSNGVLVAYGKNQVLVNRGEIAAMGEGGVGVRFDFGTNVFGNEYRGSWKWVDEDGTTNYLNLANQGLDGALVTQFDVTGTVAGSAAAIYIGDTALVEQINIMSGAALYGDIISDWDKNDTRLQIPSTDIDTTTLSFGWLADADGKVTPTADSDFSLTYQGNILGRTGMNVLLAGGTLSWQGRMDIIEYTQESGTTLLGIIGESASVISADTITLEAGSFVGVTSGSFLYSTAMEGNSIPVLTFDSASFTNNATLVDSGGTVAIGAYEYTYGAPSWLDANTVGIQLTGARYNPQRGATSATTAPLALALSNPAGDAVFGRSRDLFQYRRAAGLRRYHPDLCPPETFTGINLWASPTFGHTSRSGGTNYSVRNWGLNIGMDKWFNSCFFAGAALLLDFPEYRSTDADVDAHRVAGALYGGVMLPEEVELGLFTAFGNTRHNQKRRVLNQRHSSRYNAENFSIGTNLGRTFLFSDNRALLRPFASYDFTHLHVRGHGESLGTYALDYRSTSYDLHRLKAGTDFGWLFDSGAWVGGEVFYYGLYGDRAARTTASFSLDPQGNRFTSLGDRMDRHSLGLGVRAGMALTERASVKAEYSLISGKRDKHHVADITFAVGF